MTAGTAGAMDDFCSDEGRACCQRWAKEMDRMLGGADADAVAAALITQDVIREAKRAKLEDEMAKLEDEMAKLVVDNIRYKMTYRKLKAEARRRERRRV